MKHVEFAPLMKGGSPELFALFEECFAHPPDEAWWKWKYDLNPYGRGLNLLALVEGHLAGHYGAYGVKCRKADGESFWVNHIGDVMISPRYRGVGVGRSALITRLTHAFYDTFCEAVAFNYGCPSERHARLGRALLGYEVLDPITVWELDLQRWRMPFVDKMRAMALNRVANIFIGEVPMASECELLYQRLAHQYPLSIVKEAIYLEWRYKEHPLTDYMVHGIRKNGDLRLLGIFRVNEQTIEIGELLFDFEERYLFSMFIQHISKSFPSHRLILWCNPYIRDMAGLLVSLGFKAGKHPQGISLTAAIFDTATFPREFIRRSFFYQMGDFDLF